MLILTYEATSIDMMVPYFNHRFAPLKPIQIFGRFARGEPDCRPSFAVWYAWKDSICSHHDIIFEKKRAFSLLVIT